MAVFDIYIQEVIAYVEKMREKDGRSKEFSCLEPPERIKEQLPIRVGSNANSGIILRSDTFVELGNPLAGSCALVVWTGNPSLIRDGRITLLGPDIPESSGASLPFGQVLMAGGKDLSDKEHESLVQNQYVADQIEGYMIKSAPDRIWSRVSRQVAEKNFDFETLGKALVSIFKTEEPKIEAMEVVFVTSSKEDIQELSAITAQVDKISREIVKESWKIRGYDIECDLDCNSCGDKPVCDDIRDVLEAKKKKDKEAGKS